jgi:multicomponent Na+:H+ antiporter subunit F
MNSYASLSPMLQTALLGCLLILLATVALGLTRALRGPALEDRLAAILLLGSGGVGGLSLLALLLAAPALLDVALVLALLAAVVAAAMTRREVTSD